MRVYKREYARARRADPEQRAEYNARMRRWRAGHPGYARLSNPEARRAAERHYRERHPERQRLASARWLAANPERVRAFPSRSREYQREIRRRWVATHPDEARARNARARALRRGAVGSHTAAEWLAKVELLGGCCLYCGRSDLPLTRDHRVPLTRGGTDAITNVVPACAPCNNRKRRRTATEFIAATAIH